MSNSYEQQSKVILERINQTEKNAKLFAESVSSISRKESKYFNFTLLKAEKL